MAGFGIIKNQLCNVLVKSPRFKYIYCITLLYMRLELNIYNINNSILEYNYNEALRKIILLYLAKTDDSLARLFHDDPHYIFSFSSVLGRSHSNKYGIFIKRGVLFVSSPDKDFIFTLLKSFLKFPIFEIGLSNSTKFAVSNMRILDNLSYSSPLKLMTLSPIILKRDNKYIAIDKDSNEDDVNLWIDTLKYSVKSRYKFFTGNTIDNIGIEINRSDFKTKYIKIKDQRYLCSEGRLEIRADREVLEFINDVGLGMKQKFGFGYIEVIK